MAGIDDYLEEQKKHLKEFSAFVSGGPKKPAPPPKIGANEEGLTNKQRILGRKFRKADELVRANKARVRSKPTSASKRKRKSPMSQSATGGRAKSSASGDTVRTRISKGSGSGQRNKLSRRSKSPSGQFFSGPY